MRQGNQNRSNRQRSRGRRPSGGGGNAANKVYDSNGPDVRVRGSAQTVADKYLQLAGDAQSQGDRIKTESYFQHAEHYLRIVAANQAAQEQRQAEKEKAAEEHAARIAAKKAREQAEQEQRAAASAEKLEASAEKGEAENASKPEKTSIPEKDENWEGPQPAFLQRESAPEAEKVKKPRRKPARKKPSAKSNGNGVETAAVSSESDNGGEIQSSNEEDSIAPEVTGVT